MIRTSAARSVWAIGIAFLMFVTGFPLMLLTGSQAVGWLLMPGGMLAFPRMGMGADPRAELWFWAGAVSSIAIWAFILYGLLSLTAARSPKQHGAA